MSDGIHYGRDIDEAFRQAQLKRAIPDDMREVFEAGWKAAQESTPGCWLCAQCGRNADYFREDGTPGCDECRPVCDECDKALAVAEFKGGGPRVCRFCAVEQVEDPEAVVWLEATG